MTFYYTWQITIHSQSIEGETNQIYTISNIDYQTPFCRCLHEQKKMTHVW